MSISNKTEQKTLKDVVKPYATQRMRDGKRKETDQKIMKVVEEIKTKYPQATVLDYVRMLQATGMPYMCAVSVDEYCSWRTEVGKKQSNPTVIRRWVNGGLLDGIRVDTGGGSKQTYIIFMTQKSINHEGRIYRKAKDDDKRKSENKVA